MLHALLVELTPSLAVRTQLGSGVRSSQRASPSGTAEDARSRPWLLRQLTAPGPFRREGLQFECRAARWCVQNRD